MIFFVRHPTPQRMVVRIHPKHPAHNYGRNGATIIVPVGIQEPSELKEHIEMVNERNPGREKMTEEQIDRAVEKKVKHEEGPKSVQELLALGLRPGEHRKIR